MSDSLLEKLYRHLNKCYMSDLKRMDNEDRHRAAAYLKRNKCDAFSVACWNDTRQYLTGYRGWLTKEEAKKSLIEWLEQ